MENFGAAASKDRLVKFLRITSKYLKTVDTEQGYLVTLIQKRFKQSLRTPAAHF